MIDIDEAGFKLEHQTRKFGKTVTALRCDQAGVYGIGSKTNLLLAIAGDPVLAMRRWEIWRKGGTTLDRFANFMQVVLDDLAANPQTAGRTFTFTMDNLNVHKHPLILSKHDPWCRAQVGAPGSLLASRLSGGVLCF